MTSTSLSQSILLDRYAKPGETNLSDVFRRVSNNVGSNDRERFSFFNAMSNHLFIPAGRILAADKDRTYYNCFVLPSPHDSRIGITNTLSEMIEIMSRGGGVGINLSSLRPRGTLARKVGGQSSGAVSWGALYSFATGLIEQGGSRRGALMLILNDWHPDALEFIHSKRESGKITNANISLNISDAFMEAVENNDTWRFVFPDTTYPNYDKLWTGDLKDWQSKNLPVKIFHEEKARSIWNQITTSAWGSAEPGIVFLDRANAESNSWYFNSLICTNPCSEISLTGWGVCNLGHINLAKMVERVRDGITINWVRLVETVRTAVRFLDNVIDVTPYHFSENERVQRGERRIGLGTMGFAELLIRLGIRYGSPLSIKLAERIQKKIAETAYFMSSDLALERGTFPRFDPGPYLASGFMQRMSETIREKIRVDGMRNVCLLTQAPTGTVGTMMNTSTGIEPFFSFSHFRKTRMGMFEEKHPIVQGVKKLQDYHVTAMDITPDDHVSILCAFQKWIDNGISKTVNLPHQATVGDIDRVYRTVYERGGKGCSVYRDGSRDEQILHLPSECPECTEKTLVIENGCSTCQSCGYSVCSM